MVVVGFSSILLSVVLDVAVGVETPLLMVASALFMSSYETAFFSK